MPIFSTATIYHTMSYTLSVLYVEDNPLDIKLLEKQIEKDGLAASLKLQSCRTLGEAEKWLTQQPFALALLDLSLPDAHGLEGVLFLRRKFPALPIVVLTGNTDSSTGKEAIQNGAQDYLVKGEFAGEMLLRVCTYAVERERMRQELDQANTRLQETVEALRHEKRKVEDKNRQIQSFVSMIVHDLKNPVTAVYSLSDLMLSQKDKLNLNQIKYLNQIQYSASSMLDNILSIIDTTQAEGGNLKAQMNAESPFFTLNSALDRFVMEAIQRNIILDVAYRKDMPKAYFDKRLLANVTTALLDYLIRHAAENSRIRITSDIKDKYLSIRFTCSQSRLTRQSLEAVMNEQPELQENSSEAPGSGFSVALAKKFVEVMNGETGIEEQPPRLTFWFSLGLA